MQQTRLKISFFLLLFSTLAQASGERMGEFRFSEFALSPRLRLEEPQKGGFELKESWMEFEWRLDESVAGEIGFGTADLVAPAIWFTQKNEQLELTKAFVEGKTPIVDVRAGLVQIPQGYEGSVPEWDLRFPSTRARKLRWLIRRDYGLQFVVEHKPFLTSLTVHNGESAANSDGRMWYTGLWRVQTASGYGMSLTGTVGGTNVQSSTGSIADNSENQFNFDKNSTSKIRFGTLALYREWGKNFFLVEGGRGDIIQNDQKSPFAWGHADLALGLGGDLLMLLRYEQDQSDLKRTETMVRGTGLGFSSVSKDRLSSITLFGVKNNENPEIINDEVQLIFKLSSNLLDFY